MCRSAFTAGRIANSQWHKDLGDDCQTGSGLQQPRRQALPDGCIDHMLT